MNEVGERTRKIILKFPPHFRFERVKTERLPSQALRASSPKVRIKMRNGRLQPEIEIKL